MADDRNRDGDGAPRRRGLRAHVGSGLRVRRPGDAIEEPRGGEIAVTAAGIRLAKPMWVIPAAEAGTEPDAGIGLRSNGRRGLRAYSRPSLLRAHLGTPSGSGPVAMAAGDASRDRGAIEPAPAPDAAIATDAIGPRDDRRG